MSWPVDLVLSAFENSYHSITTPFLYPHGTTGRRGRSYFARQSIPPQIFDPRKSGKAGWNNLKSKEGRLKRK